MTSPSRALAAALLALSLLAAACGPSDADMEKKAEYHYKLANNFFYDDNPQSAIEELYRTLELDPRHAKAHHLLGFIYFGRRDYERAHEHLAGAVEIDPEYNEAMANLGNLFMATEEWERAIPYFQELLERPLYQTPYLAHNNLGWALYKTGSFVEARRHLETAIFLNPKFCLAHNNLGRIHAHEGRTDAAMERFQKAVEHCPRYAEPHYFLGRIYAALSAPDRARRHFEKCHALGPDTPFGRRCREAL